MESVEELRRLLQEPRRHVDTWYGKHVMRRFSIYLTRFFIERKWSPNQVTLLSLAAALVAAFLMSLSHFFLGIAFLNLWYLLDHVDGEVARYTKQSSPTGFYFDTVVNFIAQPCFFYGFGLGLTKDGGGIFYALAAVSAFSALLLMVLPLCEDAIVLSLSQKAGILPPAPHASTGEEPKPGFAKQCFMIWHESILFPNFLLVLTAAAFFLLFMPARVFGILSILFVYDTLSCTGIWILQLAQKVRSKKLDAAFNENKPANV